jgi:hypothetical protein
VTGYKLAVLKDMIEMLGEDRVKYMLSQFYCPLNFDVENFLHNKSIEFAKQSVSVTYLVFMPYKNNPVISGYFTLANKVLIVKSTHKLSNGLKKRISKFGVYDSDKKGYRVPAPLIAQLGKNYNNGLDTLLSGKELLLMACRKVAQVQEMIGTGHTILPMPLV